MTLSPLQILIRTRNQLRIKWDLADAKINATAASDLGKALLMQSLLNHAVEAVIIALAELDSGVVEVYLPCQLGEPGLDLSDDAV